MLNSSLSRRFLIYIIIFSSLVTILITGVQIYLEYESEVIYYRSIFQQINDVHLNSIINSLWVADAKSLNIHLQGIYNLTGILFIELKDDEKIWASFGQNRSDYTMDYVYELTRSFRSENLNIGKLTIKMDVKKIYSLLFERVWIIFLKNIIKIFLISGFILVLFRKMVVLHLVKISNFVENMKFDGLTKELKIDRKKKIYDEFEIISTVINSMVVKLKKTISGLEANRKLLQLEHGRLIDAVEALPGSFAIYDSAERLLLTNSKSLEMFPEIAPILQTGMSYEELIRKTLENGLIVIEHDKQEAYVQERLQEFRNKPADFEHRFSDGRWFSVSQRLTSEGGTLSFRQEITERKKIEKKMRDSQRLLQTIFDTIPHWLFVKNKKSEFLMVNESISKSYGLRPEKIIGIHSKDLFLDTFDEINGHSKTDRLILTTGERTYSEHFIFLPSGEKQFRNEIKLPLYDEGGDIVGIVGISENITERKLNEERLQVITNRANQAQERLVDAIESISEGFALFDSDDRLVIWNKNYVNLNFKIKDKIKQGVLFKSLVSAATERDQSLRFNFNKEDWLKELLRQHKSPGGVFEHQLSDGRWVLASERKTREGGTVGIWMDITKIKSTEKELLQSQMLLQTVFDTIPHWLMVKDRESNYLMVNKAFAKTYGKKPSDFKNISPHELGLSKEDVEKFLRADREVIETGKMVEQAEYEIKYPDGKISIQRAIRLPLFGQFGEVVGIVAEVEDITEHKILEDQLRQSQKMEAIGTLAGGIAHDFNNILQPILGFSELLQAKLSEGSREADYVSHITRAGLRAKDLVSKILLYSKQSNSLPIPIDLRIVANEIFGLMKSTLSISIKQELLISDGLHLVLCDPSEVHQMLLNIYINGAQAIIGNGNLKLELSNVELENHACHLGENLDGKYVRIAIEDNGIGMAEETERRIFDPFFTTKDVGQGTGLGLSSAIGIVKNIKGGIKVTTKLGEGTTFEIFLPVFEDGKKVIVAPFLTEGGNERIILIDDEEPIVMGWKILLEKLGYKVEAFVNGQIALNEFRKIPDQFDLIITDKNMPNLNGDLLIEKIKEIRSSIPTILVSGLHDGLNFDISSAPSIHGILEKPIENQVLAREIRRVLNEAQKIG